MTEWSLFDLLPEEEAKRFKPIKSTDWKWSFKDYPEKKNGLKVFSCFACGGGSTMGYKLAGCDVIGCCEIDPKMNEVYVKNHHPKHNFLMDIRAFNNIPNEELPEELFNLDILDGSPPCTTFSIAGDREESWGKKKKFREGQQEQTLDDLSFIFIDTVKKLNPKVVVMENVEGLILGEAFTYVQKIYKQFDEAGYKVHHWLLKGENMGIPQKRHRVIFVACRDELNILPSEMDMTFNYQIIPFKEITDGKYDERKGKMHEVAAQNIPEDRDLAATSQRINGKYQYFSHRYIDEDDAVPTLIAGHRDLWLRNGHGISRGDIVSAQTFPQDYDFGSDKYGDVEYMCGMSVPPVMMKRIVQRLIINGVFKMVINGGIDREELEDIWGKGYANADHLQPNENGLEALARYITKQQKNRRKWARSRNLKKPKQRTSDTKVSNARVKRLAVDFPNSAKEIMEKLYPEYTHTKTIMRYSDVVDGAYIRCVMRRKPGGKHNDRR